VTQQANPYAHLHCYCIILGLTACWCPMSPHILTSWVFRLLGLA